jgi:hypothetical protein
VAGSVALYFRAVSPVSARSDRIHDAVSVNGRARLHAGAEQLGAGRAGRVGRLHAPLVNNGNVVEGDGLGSFVAVTAANDQAGWSSASTTTPTAAACSTPATAR